MIGFLGHLRAFFRVAQFGLLVRGIFMLGQGGIEFTPHLFDRFPVCQLCVADFGLKIANHGLSIGQGTLGESPGGGLGLQRGFDAL